MKQEQVDALLKPRFIVIADYPGNTQPMGYIFEGIGVYFDKFPSVFKPLQWWEHRELSELPEYVKMVHKNYEYSVQKVSKWDTETGYIITEDWGSYQHLKYFQPATETDYLNYITQTK
jgi:hypothetical protein